MDDPFAEYTSNHSPISAYVSQCCFLFALELFLIVIKYGMVRVFSIRLKHNAQKVRAPGMQNNIPFHQQRSGLTERAEHLRTRELLACKRAIVGIYC